MANKLTKYKPGNTCRIALNRIRVEAQDLPDIPKQELRQLLFSLQKKWKYKAQWVQDIPPIKAKYIRRYNTRNFVLIEGAEHYQKAKTLGLDTIRCTIVDEEPPCDISSWFDMGD